MLQLTYCFDRI